MSEEIHVDKMKVLDWLEMEFNDDMGGYVSQITNLPAVCLSSSQ